VGNQLSCRNQITLAAASSAKKSSTRKTRLALVFSKRRHATRRQGLPSDRQQRRMFGFALGTALGPEFMRSLAFAGASGLASGFCSCGGGTMTGIGKTDFHHVIHEHLDEISSRRFEFHLPEHGNVRRVKAARPAGQTSLHTCAAPVV